MTDHFKITYGFKFKNGMEKRFDLLLDKTDLILIPREGEAPPGWAFLNFHQCAECPLDSTSSPYCPIAANLSGIVPEFDEITAGEEATVIVGVKERLYLKEATVQEGLGSLLGIVMTASGCPVMEPLKPMVRFHLPFASLEETVFRMASTFLMAQFLRSQAGKKSDWDLEGLATVYEEVKKLNKDFGRRMAEAAKSDVNVHAIARLNLFAVTVPAAVEKTLEEISPYFSSYLQQE